MGASAQERALHIWWFRDGRAGHERQARALVEALGRLRPVTVTESPPLRAGELTRAALGRLRPDSPDPDLLLGAGHQTHLSLLAARRSRGGRAVVIMRPSLPLRWFDLCIAPRHDGLGDRAGVLESLGPLSPVRPAATRDGANLVLVGGPSRHFRWESECVLAQVRRVVAARPAGGWSLTTSRRTPAGFLEAARRVLPPEVRLHDVDGLPEGWLDDHLPRAPACLATPDSLSMIFDCLSAGVPCGLLDLEAVLGSRVAGAVNALVAEGRAGRAAAWAGSNDLPEPPALDEADRVAEAVVDRWFR